MTEDSTLENARWLFDVYGIKFTGSGKLTVTAEMIGVYAWGDITFDHMNVEITARLPLKAMFGGKVLLDSSDLQLHSTGSTTVSAGGNVSFTDCGVVTTEPYYFVSGEITTGNGVPVKDLTVSTSANSVPSVYSGPVYDLKGR